MRVRSTEQFVGIINNDRCDTDTIEKIREKEAICSRREDQAMMTTLAGLVIVLSMVIKEISTLFTTVRTMFNL